MSNTREFLPAGSKVSVRFVSDDTYSHDYLVKYTDTVVLAVYEGDGFVLYPWSEIASVTVEHE
jgi:hypothetical protein